MTVLVSRALDNKYSPPGDLVSWPCCRGVRPSQVVKGGGQDSPGRDFVGCWYKAGPDPCLPSSCFVPCKVLSESARLRAAGVYVPSWDAGSR